MPLIFDRGDAQRPRGHALVYFRSNTDREVVFGSYVIVPPIVMDLARYIPPMFAGQLASLTPTGLPVFPIPPIPERAESMAALRAMASAREDDLIDGGAVDPNDLQRMLMTVTDLAGEYARIYKSYIDGLETEEVQAEAGTTALPEVDVDEILLSVLSNAEKVGRLAKLTGQARYAIEGSDDGLLDETIREMTKIGRHLTPQYRVTELVDAAKDPRPTSGRLAELLLQRSFKLAAEEYTALEAIDAEITRIRND